MTEDFKRKLTAILSADVEGYSRLMGEDEDSTVRILTAYRKLMSSLVERYSGRVVDSPGDNLLAEFESVRDAVRCAVEIQEELKIRNEDLSDNHRLEYRIGVNLGDVIKEGDRIYGDGVNIAARLESLADPGGICISGVVYSQVKNRLKLEYEYLGKRTVKNISEPVPVYRILSLPNTPVRPTVPEEESYSLSEKPSIAVLPFIDLSPEKDQGYFVDGLSEEILNSLTQISDLTVIARTSSFSFKGTNKTIQEIADILGVNNILEGSVRKAGNALRITAQLIKAFDGSHLWSKTYDREFVVKEIFAIQENIATSVADELKLTFGIDQPRRQLGGTNDVVAFEFYLVAKGLYYQDVTYEAFHKQLELLDKTITIDPGFALPWALKSIIHFNLAIMSPADLVSSEQNAGLNAALKAIELEPNLGKAYHALGSIHMTMGEFIKAEKAYRKGLKLTTESIDYFEYGLTLHYSVVGYLKKSHEILEEIRLNDPLKPQLRAVYNLSLCQIGDIDRAEEEYESGKAIFGDQWVLGDFYISVVRLGVKDVLSINNITEIKDPIWTMARERIESPKEGLTELRKVYSSDDKLSSMSFIIISCWASYFGDPEFALNAMEKSVKLQTHGLFTYWSPLFKEVRKLPRFKKFVRKIGLVDYWKEYGWPDLCHPVGDDDFVCE